MSAWAKWAKWSRWNQWGETQGATDTLYWVGYEDDDWDNPENWSFSPGGPGGAGTPNADLHVVVTAGDDVCLLSTFGTAKSLLIPVGGVLDVDSIGITINGPLTVLSEEAMSWKESWLVEGDIYFAAGINITYAPSMLLRIQDVFGPPHTFTDLSGDSPYLKIHSTTTIVAGNQFWRIFILDGVEVSITGGLTIELASYSNADWDDITLQGVGDATWDLDNSAVGAMTVRDSAIRNSHATDLIDATDNCTDNGDNVNWDFVATVWKWNEADEKWNEAAVKWNEAGP